MSHQEQQAASDLSANEQISGSDSLKVLEQSSGQAFMRFFQTADAQQSKDGSNLSGAKSQKHNLLQNSSDAIENEFDWKDGLVPEELDCIHQLDYLARCMTVSNQINSYYRYGERADCSKWRKNVSWCLYYRLQSKEKQQAALKERRLQEGAKESPTASIWRLRSKEEPPADFPPALPK